jgi:hypothetical protein
MMRHAVRIVRGLALIPFGAAICSAATTLRYELGFGRWNTHLMEVTIHTSGLAGKTVLFSMPAWSPGSYVLRNFVRGLDAGDGYIEELLAGKAIVGRN